MQDTTASAGTTIENALDQMIRWATRPEGRREVSRAVGRDLSSTDLWLLGALADGGPMRAGDLAQWQGVDKSTISPQVRRLEQQGLLRREPDPSDGRASLLSVTEAGERMRSAVRDHGARTFDGVLAGWSDRDRRDLARLLTRLAGELQGTR